MIRMILYLHDLPPKPITLIITKNQTSPNGGTFHKIAYHALLKTVKVTQNKESLTK